MRTPTYSRRRLIGITVILVMTAIVLVTNQSQFHLEASLYKVSADGTRIALEDGSIVGVGDQLVLEVTSTSPLYMYVFSEDSRGNAHGLFPLASRGMENPVPGHETYTLPGDGLTWIVDSVDMVGRIHILASPASDDRIEAAFAALPALDLAAATVSAAPLIELAREGASYQVIELGGPDDEL